MTKLTECLFCGHSPLVRRRIGAIVRLDDGRTVKLPPAPHDHCPKCGESFYDPETVQKVTGAAKSRQTGPRRAGRTKIAAG